MKDQTPITLEQAALYEVYSNSWRLLYWWVIPKWLSGLFGRYYGRKAQRKHRRYLATFKRIHGETKP